MEDRYTGRGVIKRFLLAAFVIVAASASATAIAAWHEVQQVVTAVQGTAHIKGIDQVIDPAAAGKPQTILLIGSDKRSKNAADVRTGAFSADKSSSDTMILMRLDPAKGATALLSLPRDLKVEIPGHGIAKLNASYALGGARLTVRTIKALTNIHVNHVINVDFHGFSKAVNALGCIYVDVDRRYYNQSNFYAKIDVPAGYQRLCGQDALSYVRYRHTDTDIVRSARQQDFLRQIKQQVSAFGLLGKSDQLLHIFSHYTASDLRSRSAILRLLKLAIASAGQPIREVHFAAKLGASYVYARQTVIARTVRQFLAAKQSSGPRGGTARTKRRKTKRRVRRVAGLANVSELGRQEALQAINARVRVFPVYYPTRLTLGGGFADQPRVYKVETREGKRYAAYRMVFSSGFIGQYYGLQGTTWTSPPILAGPHESHTIHGRRFDYYWDGTRLRLVAWRSKGAVYWVSNTLLLTLSNNQMSSIAVGAKHL
ncbi:MAG: polyisoprenyl-teichoic acid--peptidoglycan teichoic acid transferase [Solirubrobacteraceae bacterium]|nr:polyisoprenyl-teichoic acid--peptidoglycan teichoic acid transferase [Solirubrobacteraceae bacterium]